MNSSTTAKVLIIATSRKTRGGITAVLKTYEKSAFWGNHKCKWIETHRDSNIFVKLLYFFCSFIQALFYIPFYDIIHIHTSRPASVVRKLPFVIYARLFRKKVIIHLHFFETNVVFSPKYQNLYKLICKNADKIIVLSERAKREYSSDIIPAEKLQVIYNPVTTTIKNEKTEFDRLILFAGLLTPMKGYKDLIEAFATIAHKHPEWKVVLAGNGEVEQAQDLAQKLNITNQIILPGWVSGKEKEQLFSQAAIFCLPSYAEGFPMAVLDAWAYKLPVVTTPVGGLPDVLIDGENALVFEPGDTTTLATHLDRLISDEQLRHQIALNSHTLATTKFSINAISDNLERLYLNILKSN